LPDNPALLTDKAGLFLRKKYFEKNLKKSRKMFGGLEIILYLCIIKDDTLWASAQHT
jgi:hypothetical protein